MGLLEKSIGQHHQFGRKRDCRPIIGTSLMTTRGQSFEIDRKIAKQTSQTLLRGLKILELTASGKSNVPIRELAKEVNLPRSIVHRLISTLEGEGYIQKNSANPGYRLGTKLWSLGCAAAIGITVPIHRLAKENIDQLGRLAGVDILLISVSGMKTSAESHRQFGTGRLM
jgi:DNA-binding Lrp family transcriptional regulator